MFFQGDIWLHSGRFNGIFVTNGKGLRKGFVVFSSQQLRGDTNNDTQRRPSRFEL